MKPNDYNQLLVTLPFIPCPNCKGRLQPKEKTSNLCNIQCADCYFAARFVILGAEDALILSIDSCELTDLMAQKKTVPPFIFHRTWNMFDTNRKCEITTLYPFIPYSYLQKPLQTIPMTEQLTNTLSLFIPNEDDLPSSVIYTSPSDAEIAEEVSHMKVSSTSYIQRVFSMGYARAARIIDEAKKIRKRKGLPVEEQSYDDDDESDDDE